MTRATAWRRVVLGGWLIASACSVLGPLPDKSRFFTLTVQPAEEADIGRTAPGRGPTGTPSLYGLGPIILPPYLDRNQIATRVSATEVAYSQWERWAEPLNENVSSVLLQRLSAELATDDIVSYPWAASAGVTYQIAIRLLRFESDAAGDAVLMARWMVRDVPHDCRLATKTTTLESRAAAGDTAASTAALSGMLSDLAHEIATTVRDLRVSGPAQAPAPAKSPRRSRRR